MALGARPGDVLSQVLRGALAMVVAGIVFGLLGVFALTRVMASCCLKSRRSILLRLPSHAFR